MAKLPESRWCDTPKCKEIGKNHTHTPKQCGARCWNPVCIEKGKFDHYDQRCGTYDTSLPADGQRPAYYARNEKMKAEDMAKRRARRAAAAASPSTDTPAPDSSSGGAGEPAKPATWAAKVKPRKPAPVAEPAPEPAAQVATPPAPVAEPALDPSQVLADLQNEICEELYKQIADFIGRRADEHDDIVRSNNIEMPENHTAATWLPGKIVGMLLADQTAKQLFHLTHNSQALLMEISKAIVELCRYAADREAEIEAAKAAD